jgi:hypothetical protein
MKSIPIIFFMVLLISVSAHAAKYMYEWTDNEGVINFTDNPGNIPAKYLKRVKKRPSIDVKTGETAIAPPQAPAEGARGETGVLHGGHNEDWWRSEFGKPRDEKKLLEDALPAKRDALEQARRTLAIYPYPPNRQAYYDLLAEIQRDEARIEELNKQLQSLDNEASRAGVPFGWRK